MFSHFLRKLGTLTASATRTVLVAARTWRLTPDAAGVLGPGGPDLDQWLADGSAAIVKTGPHRTVYRVVLPRGTVYVKHCRISGFRAWAREVLRPAKARLEFENALALRNRGISAVVPVAWGAPDSRWPGESFLITRSHDGAIPFLAFVEQVLPTIRPADHAAIRRQLAQALGQFFARLHDAGVAHPDPHPGNLLVELTPARVPHFTLIDLHAIRFARPLSWADSCGNLVPFNRWFQLRASRCDRLRFWRAYRRSRQTLPLPDAGMIASQAREVERGTLASNLSFWSGRVSRCLGTNRYFRKIKASMIRGHAVRDLPEDVLHELLADPDAIFNQPGTLVFKDSRTSTVAAFAMPFPDGPREVVLKRVNVRHWSEPLKNLLRLSPVLRSWVNGHSLRDRWLPTPRPLAAFHRYRHGLPAEGYLLSERVPSAMDLPRGAIAPPLPVGERSACRCECIDKPGAGFVPGSSVSTPHPVRELHAQFANHPLPKGERVIHAPWADRLARTLRAMHDRAVSHRDLKAANILLERGADPAFIDLVGVRIGTAVSFRQRARELARLNASFLAGSAITLGQRLRFLRTYLAAGEAIGPDWRTWWKAIASATAAKVAKNRRSGRPLA